MKNAHVTISIAVALTIVFTAHSDANDSQMKSIPGSAFQMGSDNGVGWSPAPSHRVTISAFMMDSTEVTQEDYSDHMGVNPSTNPGDPKRPVDNVTWFDAVLYCNRRSIREGFDTVYSYTSIDGVFGNGTTNLGNMSIDFAKNGYTLPTEAEWEYAYRAGTTGPYYWGHDSTVSVAGNYAWFDENAESSNPVAQKLPNAFGLYDMSGNLYEWCHDWIAIYNTSDTLNPTGPSFGQKRVARGGTYVPCFGHASETIMTAHYRGLFAPDVHAYANGFRCVRRLPSGGTIHGFGYGSAKRESRTGITSNDPVFNLQGRRIGGPSGKARTHAIVVPAIH